MAPQLRHTNGQLATSGSGTSLGGSDGYDGSGSGAAGNGDSATDTADIATADAVQTADPRSPKSERAARRAARAQARMDADPDWPPQKTVWRGVLHQHAAGAALAGGIMLIIGAPGGRAKAGCAVYAGALTLQLFCSALYHVPSWRHGTRTWLRRLDHACIFTLIAGTYTPLCMLALDHATATRLLCIEWGAAFLGMMQTLFWVNAPKQMKTVTYIFLGWAVLPYAGEMRTALGSTGAWLVAAGGVIYTVGGTIYAFKWPNPSPKYFGYHEIFHAATLLASLCHFSAVYRMAHSLPGTTL
jgi:hemolysin III